MAVTLELLTDEAILDYTRSNGREHVVFNHRDLNLRNIGVKPYTGGIFDLSIFGSPYTDRCWCGNIKQPSKEPCPNCGCMVFTREEALRRFARLELPFYYLNDLRLDIFLSLFDEIFKDTKITKKFINDDLKGGGYSTTKSGKSLGIKVFDSCQFEYNPEAKELVITEFITDESKCSYEGLMKIIETYFPSYLREYMKLINHYYLILPAVMRPFTIRMSVNQATGKSKKLLGNHPMSVWYSALIRLCCVEDDDPDSSNLNYKDVMDSFSTPGERVRYTALLRAFINAGKKMTTELLNTTKENFAREIYSVRTNNSARCPIVPSADIAIDELKIPRHLAYEMLKEGFAQYLCDELNFTKKQALRSVKNEAMNDETQKLFKEYAEKQYVLINRPPSLHEYSTFCMKVRLWDEYAIGFPIAVCQPLNADFDGDATSLQIVPPDVAEDTYAKMSPRYNNVYKKNNEPIFPFNHETLNGLAVMTEFTPTDGDSSELNDPRYYYTNYVDVLKDYEVEHKIKIGTPITFNGKIGSENYKNKITCYGKLKLSKILDRDIDKLSILKDDRSRMDAKAAAKLSAYLNKEEDGVEKRLEIQKAALKAVTEAGVVTFSYKTLYVDTNTETYKEICKIADSDDLTDQQKLALLTDKYAKYEKEIQAKFSDDLKNELSRAGRVKLSSISALNMPSLIINGVEETPIITRGNLLGGFSEKDMIYHSIENRSLQSIKQSGVPSSGYITRQISFVLNNYVYHDGEDKDDPGLLIPRYKALGRTAPNGILYPDKELARGSEEDLVPVRSVVTKNKGDLNTITPDMIGTKFNMTDGTAIGLSFSTSFTEAITQGALGLKHGGHEKQLDKTGYLVCEHSSCTFREEGKWFYIKSRGKEYKYPRPDNLVTFGKDTFVKGENICCAYNTISPINGLNSLIQLMNARGSAGYRYYEKENITVSDCYAYSDGEIRYVETPEGEIEVHIGSVVYQYNPLCMYYFADGEKVKKYDRICNGVINMPHVISYFGNDINSIYLIFRKQFYSLNDKGFLKDNGKNGLTDLHAMQEEIVELVFRGLTSVTYDPVTAKIEEIEYQGSNRAILGKNSFFTTLSYGHARKTVGKALKGEVDLSDDVMTETVLGMLLNNTLDD